MNEFSIADLFFIITGSAVIIITALMAIGLLYLIFFLRTIKKVAKTAQRGVEMVSEDLAELSQNIKEKGFNLSALASFAKSMAKKTVFGTKKNKK